MVLTSRTRTALFARMNKSTAATPRPEALIRLPLSVVPKYEVRCDVTGEIRRKQKPLHRTNLWTSEEHELFLQGLERFPNGPWREVAAIVGTKTTRQTMTHAQKYRQKIERRMRASSPQPNKPRRRSKPSTSASQRTAVAVKAVEMKEVSHAVGQSFVDLLMNDSSSRASDVASPSDIWTDVIEATFTDQELDSLISSLGPRHRCCTSPVCRGSELSNHSM